LRRTLGDDPRDPLFIRTVSRHGYRFVGQVLVEEDDDEDVVPRREAAIPAVAFPDVQSPADRFEPLLQRLAGHGDEEEQRDAAERLHALGTGEALARLGVRPGHARARALLRDTRWDVAGAGAVPFVGHPGAASAAASLIVLRLRRMARLAAARAGWASVGGAWAGLLAGFTGGVLLIVSPGSQATLPVAVVLAVIGSGCGALGGAGVGAGLSAAEAVARSRRVLWLAAGGALGGAVVGGITEWLASSILLTLVGVHLPVGGGAEGLAIGAAAGLGYALATRRAVGGLATPRGRDRLNTVLVVAIACALAALALTLSGRALVGGTIHALAKASAGSQAALTPIARLIGEPDFGPLTRAAIGTGEGAIFGVGLAMGLTRRPS
jgi:hypothetical protein